MVDIPLAPPTPSSSAAPTTTAAPGLVAVQVSVTNVPLALENLVRTIQANATPLLVSDANNLTLSTILGSITVALSQHISAAEKQNLTQQLMALMQAQRSLTLTLQPGSPPTQGALLFPMTSAPPVPQNIKGHALPSAPAPQAQVLTTGSRFHAVVLPPAPSPAAVLAEAPSPTALTTFAALRPLNPAPITETIFTAYVPSLSVQDVPVTNKPATNVVQQPAVSIVQGADVLPQPAQPMPQTIPPPTTQTTYSAPQASVQPLPPTSVPVQQAGPSPVAMDVRPLPPTSLPPVILATPFPQQTVSPVPPKAVYISPQPILSSTPQTPIPLQQTGVSTVPLTPIPVQQPNISTTQTQELPQQPKPPVSYLKVPSAPTQVTGAAPQPLSTPQSVVSETPSPPVMTKTATPPPMALPSAAPPPVQVPLPSSSQVSSLLTPGSEVSLHVVSVLSGSADAPARQAFLPSLAPNQFVATVSGTGTNGQLILKAGEATLFVKSQLTAPIGTSVIVSVDDVTISNLVTLPTLEEIAFPALPQILAALEQVSPRVFQNVMLNFLPRPTDSLPGALMFLLSAFGQGSVRNWLGNDAVDVLANAGKSAIVRNLSKELKSTGQPAQDAVVGEWRSYPIPLFSNQQFQALTLYVHNDRDARKDEPQSPSGVGKIRFLIDMRLSKLGAMQIDGFVQSKKLDMILRSENMLPEGLHQELRQGYIKALEAVGYAGTLNFQVGRHHWMIMQKSAPEGIVT